MCARYDQDLAGERPDRAAWLAIYWATATWHRVYALWHWSRWMRRKPVPVSRVEGHDGLRDILPPLPDIDD